MQTSDEARELCQVVRDVLADGDSLAVTRRMLEDGNGYDARLVQRLAEDLGLAGLTVPEEHDGAAAGLGVVLPVCGELGRALAASPFLATTVLAVSLLRRSGDDEAGKQWLPGLAAGRTTAAVVVPSDRGDWRPEQDAVRVVGTGDDWTLDGTCDHVIDGASADLLLVVADDQGTPALFAVDGTATGLDRQPTPSLDPSRPLATVVLDGVPARRISTQRPLTEILAQVHAVGLLALAAESWGGAQRCLEIAVEYAQQRHAFGRPIGGFQAIKHKLANLAIEVEYARAAVARAATLSEDDSELAVVARIAVVQATETFALAAQELIQVHGGIGFTWEHDAHLYSRRARTNLVLLGRPRAHHDAIAAVLLD